MNLQNLKISVRHLLRNKYISIINIFGLSVGITCCIIIFLYLQYELSFDQHQTKKERIFRLTFDMERPQGFEKGAGTPFPLGEAIRLNINNVDEVVRIHLSNDNILFFGDKKIKVKNTLFVEPGFFNVFDVEWIVGDPVSAFSDPNSVVLTESMYNRLFGTVDGMNEIIELGKELDLKISGIIKDPLKTTSIPFDMIAPIEAFTIYFYGMDYNQWTYSSSSFETYVLIPQNVKPDFLEQQINSMYESLIFDHKDAWKIYLQPISDIHFSKDYGSLNYTIQKSILWILGLIGILILLIACINYINLSIPLAIKRSNEIGIRKVIGAEKAELFKQFFAESMVMIILSVIISILLCEVLLPWVNNIIGEHSNLRLYGNRFVIIFFAILIFAIFSLTGIYPALIISRFKPIEALKNKITSHSSNVKCLRNGLLLFQLIVTQILIVCAIIISKQVDYFLKKDIGFNKESIVGFPIPDASKKDFLYGEIISNSNIIDLSVGYGPPLAHKSDAIGEVIKIDDGDKTLEYDCEVRIVDENYFNTFGLQLVAGEWLPESGLRDSAFCVLINETASKMLGFQNPVDILGYNINFGRIVGVLKDFHMGSFHHKIFPMVMLYYPPFFDKGFAKINNKNQREALALIEEKWNNVFPDYIFEYYFYDDYLRDLYKEELRIFNLIKVFSMLAIIITCLGLFGIISFIIIQKEKEIAIRKVFGANLQKLFKLLSRNYFMLVIVANILAVPFSYYLVNAWLNNFTYKISVGIYPFIFSLLAAMIITFISISYQVTRATIMNPIKVLKYE